MSKNLSDENIEKILKNPELAAAVDEPSTLERIQAEFEDSFAMVKDKLGDSWQDVRTIYEMSFDRSFKVKKDVKIIVIAALAYLISPIDLLPERVLGPLGLADDVVILLFALKFARPEIERYRQFKVSAGGSPQPEAEV